MYHAPNYILSLLAKPVLPTYAVLCCLFSHIALFDPMDCSPPGVLQARILEWVAMPSSQGSFRPRDLSDPGIETTSLVSPALVGGFFTTRATWKIHSSRALLNLSKGQLLSIQDQLQSLESSLPLLSSQIHIWSISTSYEPLWGCRLSYPNKETEK